MVKPFAKWAGGKTQSLKDIEQYLPKSFDRYIEPFVGGGALFFHLKSRGIGQNYFINDKNERLICAYRIVRDSVEELIENLKRHQNNKEYYNWLRNLERTHDYTQLTSVERASRFIFLNKTCFNGLYRCNSKGFFNTPYGKYKEFKIDCENLRHCSLALRDVEIFSESYLRLETKIDRGDFVYFDPPYIPINLTSNFTSYTEEGFNLYDQTQLKEMCDRLSKSGVKWMLSNSDCELSRELYKNYKIVPIQSKRSINCNGNKRQKIGEILVINY